MKRTANYTECEGECLRTLVEKQSKGAEKYGHGIDHTDTHYDWISECIEELADGLQYAVAAKLRRDDDKVEIIKLIYALNVKTYDVQSIECIVKMIELM